MAMSAAVPSTSRDQLEITTLRRQLQQREFHLAELIDEVVYAEQVRDDAIAKSRGALVARPVTHGSVSLERAFQELLCFDLTLFSDVIVPVLLEVVAERGAADSTIATMLRHDAIHNTLEGLLDDGHLQKPTKELVYKVLRHSSSLRDSLALSPSAPTRVSTNTIQLERAVVLSGLLLRRQDELLESLSAIREALNGVYSADVSAHDYGADIDGESSTARQDAARVKGEAKSGASATAYVRKLERERDALQLQLLNSDQRHSLVDALVEEKKLLEQEVVRLQQKLIDTHMQVHDGQRATATPHRPVPPPPPPPSAPQTQLSDAVTNAEVSGDAARDLHRQLEEARAENQHLREALAAARRAPPGSQLVLSPPSPQAVMHDKVGELETLVASLRGSLHTMESRVETLQSLRERERERIMERHAQEVSRIRKERDECEVLVQIMSGELHALAKESRASAARQSQPR